ncbi:MAG: CBO0543 family protein, partial [Bacillota bacterium]
LYFFIDRKKIFLIGFYGFNIHVWFGYIDTWGNNQGLWGYPYKLIPFIPGSLSLDAALIPVLFMLVYQWTLNHKKNYYIYTLGVALFLSFVLKPLLVMHNLFVLHKWVNYFYLFIAYCFIFLFSKLITNIFIIMQKKAAK